MGQVLVCGKRESSPDPCSPYIKNFPEKDKDKNLAFWHLFEPALKEKEEAEAALVKAVVDVTASPDDEALNEAALQSLQATVEVYNNMLYVLEFFLLKKGVTAKELNQGYITRVLVDMCVENVHDEDMRTPEALVDLLRHKKERLVQIQEVAHVRGEFYARVHAHFHKGTNMKVPELIEKDKRRRVSRETICGGRG